MRLSPLGLLILTDLAFVVAAVLLAVQAVSMRHWAYLVMSFVALMAAAGLTLAVLGARANTTTRR